MATNSPFPPFMKSIVLMLTWAALAAVSVHAQSNDKPQVKIKGLKLTQMETPQFAASNVPDKRWRPKNWLELDLEFDVKLPPSAGGRNGSLPSIMVNYYLMTSTPAKDGKRDVIKGSFNYVDIPAAETCHALAFVSPSSLRRIMSKDTFVATSDITTWGIEVIVDGQRAAGESSGGAGPWWETGADKCNFIDGVMLSKRETPFGILWGDYDVPVRKQ